MTLGCKVNQYESEAMKELFIQKNYEITEDDYADFYIVNTCTVTQMSDRKSRSFIRKSKKTNPNSVVAVVGCYPQVSKDKVTEIEEADVILGTQDRKQIVEIMEESYKSKKRIISVKEYSKDSEFENLSLRDNEGRTRAYIKIQEGCNMFCTYCIIPYARGPVRSRDFDSIIKEAIDLRNNGYKEVVLTGIHASSYGIDKKEKYRLIDIIEEVGKIEGIERIRLSSLEPRIITEEFLNRLIKVDKFCESFHLSLQSGSSEILKKMNRKYDYDLYREKIELIRKYYENPGITTDIIVGFPGESEENFLESKKAIEEIEFTKVHLFKYSRRRGTPAAEFENQIDPKIKNERLKVLEEVSKKAQNKIYSKQIGRLEEVLVEKFEDGKNYGYSKNYSHVKIISNENLEGKIVSVIIEDTISDTLITSKII